MIVTGTIGNWNNGQQNFDKDTQTIHWRKNRLFNSVGTILWHKNEVGPLPCKHTKINSKWIRDLNLTGKSIKVLEENNKSL